MVERADGSSDLLASSRDFASALNRLQVEVPRAASPLISATQNRSRRLVSYQGGARLRGLGQLLEYFDQAHNLYRGDSDLAPAALLIERLIADFETALEATLSGFPGVMSDAMRDTIEIECLLLDFAVNPEHLNEWHELADRERRRKFAPGEVRKRLEAEGVAEFSASPRGRDYSAHSAALHVTPKPLFVGRRGLEESPTNLWEDAGFWEMFEHGHRSLLALEALRVRFSDSAEDSGPLTDLEQFHDARTRTQELMEMAIGLMLTPELESNLGRKPTSEEILKYARERLSARREDSSA